MKRFLLVLAMAMYFAFGCFGHVISEFHYINSGRYSPIPLKVISVHLDKNFGESDKIFIDDALKQWNYALNGYVKLEMVDTQFDLEPSVVSKCLLGDCWMIMKVRSDNPMVAVQDAPQKGKTWTLAWVNEVGGNRMWLIRDRMSNEIVTGVTLHEMGHLLGAGHDNVYLMKPIFNWEEGRCVDYEALKRVAEYQHLPMASLNYCVYGPAVKFTGK